MKEYRTIPAVLAGFHCFVVPVCAFYESHGESRAACLAPVEELAQIGLYIPQIRLDHDPGVRPLFELRLGEHRFEKFKRDVFVIVTFHVEINEGAELSCAAQNRP